MTPIKAKGAPFQRDSAHVAGESPDLPAMMTALFALAERGVSQLEAIRAAVERRESKRRLLRADRERLRQILAAIAGVRGSNEFLVRELLADPDPALRLALKGLTPKAFGRLLARAEGVPLGDYVVQRLGTDGGTALWYVAKVVSNP